MIFEFLNKFLLKYPKLFAKTLLIYVLTAVTWYGSTVFIFWHLLCFTGLAFLSLLLCTVLFAIPLRACFFFLKLWHFCCFMALRLLLLEKQLFSSDFEWVSVVQIQWFKGVPKSKVIENEFKQIRSLFK